MSGKFNYSGYKILKQEDKDFILEKLKSLNVPIYDNLFLHHCTIEFGTDTLDEKNVERGYLLRVSEVVFDDRCVCLVVDNATLSKNTHPHITVSTNNDTKPVYSNTMLLDKSTKRVPFKYSFYTMIEKFYK